VIGEGDGELRPFYRVRRGESEGERGSACGVDHAMDGEGPRVQGEWPLMWLFQTEEHGGVNGGAREVDVQTQGHVLRPCLRCLRERVRVKRCHCS